MGRAFGPHLAVFRELTSEEGRRWLASLPHLVASLEAEWGVETGQPFPDGAVAWTAPAVTADGEAAVLKVCWPHPEARGEGAGLRLWAGRGAVRVLRQDPSRWALLVERCVPGVALHRCGLPVPDALGAAASVLVRLWSVPVPADPPFPRLGAVTRQWAALVRDRMARHRPPFDPGLVAAGASLLETLPGEGHAGVVLHGDFNPGNVLSAQRAPWLAVDPKPMVGDPGYDPAPLLVQLDEPSSGTDAVRGVRERHQLFADLVGVAGERTLAWGVARKVESALWNVAHGRPAAGARDLDAARLLAGAAGM